MKRIQRKRTKGWKNPPNTRYVGRGTVFGNPFKDVGDMIYVDAKHRRTVFDKWVYYGFKTEHKNAATLYRDLLFDPESHEVEPEVRLRFYRMRKELSTLEGKNLSCFCELDSLCHADALISLLEEHNKSIE